MISFIPMLAEHLGVKDQELLEKDVRLHSLLGAITRDRSFGIAFYASRLKPGP